MSPYVCGRCKHAFEIHGLDLPLGAKFFCQAKGCPCDQFMSKGEAWTHQKEMWSDEEHKRKARAESEGFG